MLAGDVAQELGLVGGNLDQLAGAGSAVEPAGAVLAVLAALVLDVAQERQELGVLAGGRGGGRPGLELEEPAGDLAQELRLAEPHHLGGDHRPAVGAEERARVARWWRR